MEKRKSTVPPFSDEDMKAIEAMSPAEVELELRRLGVGEADMEAGLRKIRQAIAATPPDEGKVKKTFGIAVVAGLTGDVSRPATKQIPALPAQPGQP